MAKKPVKQLSPERKELISKLIDEFDIKSAKDIEDAFKEMFSPMLQDMLEGELDDHLGYGKYERSGVCFIKRKSPTVPLKTITNNLILSWISSSLASAGTLSREPYALPILAKASLTVSLFTPSASAMLRVDAPCFHKRSRRL